MICFPQYQLKQPGDHLEAYIGYLAAESDKPILALRVSAEQNPSGSFNVQVLPSILLQDSLKFHGSMWQDCYDKNWWKPEYRGN